LEIEFCPVVVAGDVALGLAFREREADFKTCWDVDRSGKKEEKALYLQPERRGFTAALVTAARGASFPGYLSRGGKRAKHHCGRRKK
jgi:hypothetical protein